MQDTSQSPSESRFPRNQFMEAGATKHAMEMVGLLERQYGFVPGKNLFHFEDPIGGHDEDACG